MDEKDTTNDNLPPIHVESEWSDLKECVYGSPDNWVLPLIYNDAKLRAQGEFGKFLNNLNKDSICELEKSIYGLIQATRGWYIKMSKVLIKNLNSIKN